ncbi:hypothetical protein Mapa_017773 [Marchantia paleacea]|nr:hypothetical protein Mapa_017773 [Marchantia paleacea]
MRTNSTHSLSSSLFLSPSPSVAQTKVQSLKGNDAKSTKSQSFSPAGQRAGKQFQAPRR